MRIGELATATGTSARSLRFYEERGLLAARRASNGYRGYDDSAVRRVRSIRYLLDAGLTLDDVGHFGCCLDGELVDAPASPALIGVASRRLAVLDERIRALTRVRDQLATGIDEAHRRSR